MQNFFPETFVRIFTLVLLCVNVSPLFAEAPTTPKILFTSAHDGNREIYIMNPDGSEQVNLTKHPATDQEAVWSPTGEQILFVSDRRRTHVRDLYLMDSNGSNVRRVFKKKIEGWRTDPTWSPDGKHIAYRQWDPIGGGASGMYILTLGEQEPEFIGKFSSPVWSPDGTTIACGTASPGLTWIILMDARTRKHKRLLPKKALPWQTTPSWSATSDKLAFSGNNHPLPGINGLVLKEARALHNEWRDKQTIFIVNRDGTGLKQVLAEDGSDAWAPALSPSGEEVLYTQEINQRNQVFKVDVNSGIRTQLTHNGMPRFGNFGGDWFDPSYALPVSPQPQLLTTTWAQVKKK